MFWLLLHSASLSQGLFGVSDSACEEACKEMGGNWPGQPGYSWPKDISHHRASCPVSTGEGLVTVGDRLDTGQQWGAAVVGITGFSGVSFLFFLFYYYYYYH